MKTKKDKTKVKDLIQLGFKRTTVKGLYITNNGKAYNFTTQRNLTTNRGRLTFNNKEYNLAKLVLETFSNTPIRGGYVNFINGNKKDFLYTNLEYKTTIKQNAPSEKDLIKCIRLYFPVFPNFNKNSFLFKYYLSDISQMRGFEIRNKKYKGSNLFFEWLNFKFTGESKSIYNLSKKHGYGYTNCKNEIYKYFNLLVKEILQDYENGFLQLIEFKKPIRKKSNKQLLKDYIKFSIEFNKKIDEQIKDIKAKNELILKTVAKLTKQINHNHFFIENGILYESYNTLRGLRYLEKFEVLGMPNEKKCSEICLFYIVKQYLE